MILDYNAGADVLRKSEGLLRFSFSLFCCVSLGLFSHHDPRIYRYDLSDYRATRM